MSITPKTSIYINVFVAVLAAIVSGGVSLSGLVPDPINHDIIRWSAFILSIFSVVNAALHSVSAPSDGPLTNVRIKLEKLPPKDVVTVCAGLVLLLGFTGATLGVNPAAAKNVAVKVPHVAPVKLVVKPVVKPAQHVATPVEAEIYPKFAPIEGATNPFITKPVEATFDTVPVWDVAPGADTLRATVPNRGIALQAKPLEVSAAQTGILSDIWKKLQNVTLSDLEYANNLAINHQDTVASTCYGALINLIQKSQTANIDPTTGKPLDLPPVHLVSDFENLIIIYRELQPTSTTSVACAPLMNAVKIGSITALLTGFGTGSLISGLIIP